MKLEAVARPEGVHDAFMHKRLVCLTDKEPSRESAPAPALRANQLPPAAIAHLEMRARLPGIEFPERSDLLIYVIGSAKGPVKIGISCNPLMRMRQLQTSTPDKLAVLAFVSGTYDHEKALHAFYKRERLTGEWFRRSKRIGEFIDDLNARYPEIERLRGES